MSTASAAPSPPVPPDPRPPPDPPTENGGAPPPPTPMLRVTATFRSPSGTNNNNAGEAVAAGRTPGTIGTGQAIPGQGQGLVDMRDRLFLALFFRVSLIYARAFPKTVRRVLEFGLLMQSFLLLGILGYIHIVYTRTPITCLSEYKNSWPKQGVLRVEISNRYAEYDLIKSYAKEERLRQRGAASQFGQYTDDFFSFVLTADTALLDRMVATAGGFMGALTGTNQEVITTDNPAVTGVPGEMVSTSAPSPEDVSTTETLSTTDSVSSSVVEPMTKTEHLNDVQDDAEKADKNQRVPIAIHEDIPQDIHIVPSTPVSGIGAGSTVSDSIVEEEHEDEDVHNPDSPYFNKTLEEIETMKMEKRKLEEDSLLNSSVTDFEMFSNSIWTQEQAYIVEYALEYGFLRLSPETRQRLGIPVQLVILDPAEDTCFGSRFSLVLLENFLGYDDILMSSIKNLAESEDNKGYLRNVVTGEQFRFVPIFMARTSYIPALLIMLVFTISISMLLRYSHHQIFVFIVDLLNNMEGAGNIHIPAAPLFTVILALVGMEAIMSEFFNDSSTAFYVILIVWVADQFDSVCCHTTITKRYWVRFFYLYHFAFYAYHYRFNGQYGGLALLVSWSFIQHSMIYFYHHYELPAILRQAHSNQSMPTDQGIPDPTPAPAAAPTQAHPASNSQSSGAGSPPTGLVRAPAPPTPVIPARVEPNSMSNTTGETDSSNDNASVTTNSSQSTSSTDRTDPSQGGNEIDNLSQILSSSSSSDTSTGARTDNSDSGVAVAVAAEHREPYSEPMAITVYFYLDFIWPFTHRRTRLYHYEHTVEAEWVTGENETS